jgi:hypothetical protein
MAITSGVRAPRAQITIGGQSFKLGRKTKAGAKPSGRS